MQSNPALSQPSRLLRAERRIRSLPLPRRVQQQVLTFVLGLAVPYLRTSSIELEELSAEAVTLRLRNRRKVQNHIKTVHASAMFLLAEAATGCVLTANLPDGSRFVTKHSAVDYVRKAEGDLRAVAQLTLSQREQLRQQSKGELIVPVMMTDQNGDEPATFSIEWSWQHPRGTRAQ